jgi:hypothetical protein
MRSAQRQKKINQKAKYSSILSFSKILFLPFLLIFIFLFIKFSTHNWNDKDKFIFTYKEDDGDVVVVVLDPKLGEETKIVIPGETEVIVARNYGTLRIKNVWKLSQNEKLEGKLLPETVTQNFLFPVSLWSDSDAASITSSNVLDIIKFIFLPLKTNISIGDRLSAGIFALKVHDLDKTEIDMGKSQFLHKEKLSDGQIGYRRISGLISQRLGVYFSDNTMSEKNIRFYIVDATGEAGVASLVGQILEVMGGKVVSVDKKQEIGDYDCQVMGSDKDTNRKVASLFSCSITNEKTDFDLEIKLGEKFAKRF